MVAAQAVVQRPKPESESQMRWVKSTGNNSNQHPEYVNRVHSSDRALCIAYRQTSNVSRAKSQNLNERVPLVKLCEWCDRFSYMTTSTQDLKKICQDQRSNVKVTESPGNLDIETLSFVNSWII